MEKERIKIDLSQSSTNASPRWKKRMMENVMLRCVDWQGLYRRAKEVECNKL
jgi:hypothetical protein